MILWQSYSWTYTLDFPGGVGKDPNKVQAQNKIIINKAQKNRCSVKSRTLKPILSLAGYLTEKKTTIPSLNSHSLPAALASKDMQMNQRIHALTRGHGGPRAQTVEIND